MIVETIGIPAGVGRGGWLELDAGSTYHFVFRVHNRSWEPQRLSVGIGRSSALPDARREELTVPGRGHVDLRRTIGFDEALECRFCLRFEVRAVDRDRPSDLVGYAVRVHERSGPE